MTEMNLHHLMKTLHLRNEMSYHCYHLSSYLNGYYCYLASSYARMRLNSGYCYLETSFWKKNYYYCLANSLNFC